MILRDGVLQPVLARAKGQMSVDLLAMDHPAISELERDVAVTEHAVSGGGLDPEQRRRLVRSLLGGQARLEGLLGSAGQT